MKMPVILAIETSCDETAAAVTQGDQILASEKWTQTEHAEWGGVVPSLAKRAHEEKIETIINQVLVGSKLPMSELDAVAVTVGPGLAIALEVGIRHAKEWAKKLNKPLIGVNHIEGHILSALVESGRGEGWESISFPCLGLDRLARHPLLTPMRRLFSRPIHSVKVQCHGLLMTCALVLCCILY
jgi:N6-L-threonylcarbamoyladenine synthase